MKNLKKLATLTALLALSNMTKAEEKDFTPMGKAEAIESIQLVNGQIMVKPQDGNVPYYFVSTNTENFVDKAFANADMTNLNSTAINEDAVWATRNGKLLKYPFAQNDLNNVPTQIETNNLTGVSQVISANGNDVIAFTTEGALASYHIEGNKATTNSIASTSYKNGDDTYTAQKSENTIDIFKGEGVNWKFSNTTTEPTSLVAFGDKKLYLLTDDGNLYSSIQYKINNKLTDKPIMTGITSLAATKDGNGLLISDNTGKVTAYSVDSNGVLPLNSKGQFIGTTVFEPTQQATTSFTANGIMYYAQGKKLGFERN